MTEKEKMMAGIVYSVLDEELIRLHRACVDACALCDRLLPSQLEARREHLARILGKEHIKVTVGNDKNVAAGIETMGARHQNCEATEVCVDSEHKVVTTPCYMLAASLKEICDGTRNLVDEMLELMDY